MSERDGTTPAVWDPTANGGAGGWVRREPRTAALRSGDVRPPQDPRAADPGAAGDAEETAVLPPVPDAPPSTGTVPPQNGPAGQDASPATPTELDQPVVRPYFAGGAADPSAPAPGEQPPFVPPGVRPPGAAAPGGAAGGQTPVGPASPSDRPTQSAAAAAAGADIPTVTSPHGGRTAPYMPPGVGAPAPDASASDALPTVSAPAASAPPGYGAGFTAPPQSPGYAPGQPPGYAPVQSPGYAPGQAPGYAPVAPPPFQRPDFGGHQPPPPAYAGGDAGGGGKPQGMSTGVLVVLVVVVAALLGVGAVWGLGLGRSSHGSAGPSGSPVASGDGSPSASASDTTGPSGSPSDSAAPSASATGSAQAQAQAVDTLLGQSRTIRQSIGSAATDISGCTNLASAQGAFQTAANSRQSLANEAATLDVSQLPNGAALMQQLAQAERDSASADNAYASYAASLASGSCTPNAPLPQTVTDANTTATNDKETFVVEWDQIAGQYGLPSWTKNDF